MSHLLRFTATIALSMLASVAAARADWPAAKATRPDGTKNRAAWMAQGTYGLDPNYLPRPKGNTPAEITADINRIVNQFDMDYFVRQFQETGADWLFVSLGQGSGCLLSPNSMLDAKNPGHTPQRDLGLEFARRLKPLGKRVILYFTSATSADPAIKQALGDGTDGYADRFFELVRQYSLKFGPLYHGWWFDGCGGPYPDQYWNKWIAAARAGNPDAVVSFSGGEFCGGRPIDPICRLEDYTGGEIHLLEDGKIRRDFLWPPGEIIVTSDKKLRKRGQEARYYLPDGPFLGNVQWHGFLPIGKTYNPAVPDQFCRYTDEELFQFARRIKSVGGAITIGAPSDPENGHIPEDTHSQLVRLSKFLAYEGRQKSVSK